MDSSLNGPGCRTQSQRGASTSYATHALQRQAHAARGARGQRHGRRGLEVRNSTAIFLDEENLLQVKDRDKWYTARFSADDAPDWNPARFVSSGQLAPGLRQVVLEVEISRDKVPLRNAYKHVGQRARVRVNGGAEEEATVACAPHSAHLQRAALLKARNDLSAGEVKTGKKEDISVLAPLVLLVGEAQPDLYALGDDKLVELGPCVGTGLDLRGPLAAIFGYPTLVIFAEGRGIATARALVEAAPEEGGLSLKLRADARLYYRAPNQDALCYRDQFDEWEERYGVKVITGTRDTFQDLFDDDDTLAYEPASTAAIILTGGDAEAERAALAVCKEAEITEIVRDSQEQEQTVYIDKGADAPASTTPKDGPKKEAPFQLPKGKVKA